jgi:hypothetical protein
MPTMTSRASEPESDEVVVSCGLTVAVGLVGTLDGDADDRLAGAALAVAFGCAREELLLAVGVGVGVAVGLGDAGLDEK